MWRKWPSPLRLLREALEAPPEDRVTLRFRDSGVDETTQHMARLEALKAADEYLKKSSGRKTIIIEIQ